MNRESGPRRWRRGASTALAAAILTAALPVAGASAVRSHVVPLTAAPCTRVTVDVPAATTLVIAHRGASAVAPENTLPAMRAAAAAGADLVEFDVQRTADGHLIVVHDTTFARTTDVAQVFPSRVDDPIGSFTLRQVRQLDAGSWFSPRFAGTRIPTLIQLLKAMRGTRTDLLLELKNPWLYPGYARQTAHVLGRYGYLRSHRVWVHSFGAHALAEFHRAAPDVPVGLITESGKAWPRADTWITSINTTTAQISDASVDAATSDDVRVLAWPADEAQDDPTQIRRLIADGVSGVITDRPRMARTIVDAAEGTTRRTWSPSMSLSHPATCRS